MVVQARTNIAMNDVVFDSAMNHAASEQTDSGNRCVEQRSGAPRVIRVEERLHFFRAGGFDEQHVFECVSDENCEWKRAYEVAQEGHELATPYDDDCVRDGIDRSRARRSPVEPLRNGGGSHGRQLRCENRACQVDQDEAHGIVGAIDEGLCCERQRQLAEE